ncbi:MAG: hypothetical protein JXA03_10895 [Bacteroidales bacterium]|nr:hypothetical protein [Bacteroidales bacterium]
MASLPESKAEQRQRRSRCCETILFRSEYDIPAVKVSAKMSEKGSIMKKAPGDPQTPEVACTTIHQFIRMEQFIL